MELPHYDIRGLLNLPEALIEKMHEPNPEAAAHDLKGRLEIGLTWDVCVVQQGHGFLLLTAGMSTYPIRGIHYQTPSCGQAGPGAFNTARMLKELGAEEDMGVLQRGIVAQYSHLVIRDLTARPLVIEEV